MPRRALKTTAHAVLLLAAASCMRFLLAQRRVPAGPAIEAEVDHLLGQMTLEEKLLQLISYAPNGVPRLGIPNLRSGEALHGVVSDGATAFPQSIGLGSTWDPALMEQIGTVIAQESRAVGLQQAFAPMLGLARDPRWGRVEESYGEDAYLVSRLGTAYIEGLQGMGAARFGADRIFATPKHFVADGEPWAGENGEDLETSDRVLREVFMPPFEAAITEAHAESIMPAHHAINGVPSHANTWLLNEVLREEWSFEGFVTSDMGDIPKLYGGHRFAGSPEDAAIKAIEAGVDVELSSGQPRNYAYLKYLDGAVRNGHLPVSVVDRSVRRVLRAKLELLGLSRPTPSIRERPEQADAIAAYTGSDDIWAKLIEEGKFTTPASERRPDAQTILSDPAHDALALKAAQESIVLLKNENGLLPLDKSLHRHILVTGPLAGTTNLGGYSTGRPKFYTTALQGIQNEAGTDSVVYRPGCTLDGGTEEQLKAALEAAGSADIVLAIVGHTRSQAGENHDRDNLDLPGGQERLIESLAATGKPVIVILNNGAPFAIEWIHDHVPAVIESWYGGQSYGQALAQLLFGEVNPSGKLNVSFPRSAGQIPAYYNHPILTGPINFKPSQSGNLWSFGHGLSYTTFAYSNLTFSTSTISLRGIAQASVQVSNTGKRAGGEVVQLYLHQDGASLKRPILELKGFARISLQPGETKTVTFPIGFEQIKFWKDSGWTAEAGDVSVAVGAASDDLRLKSILHFTPNL
jgi:beta-glucosidase